MDAIEMLTRDHRKVEELFGKLERTADPSARAELVQELADEVLVHAHVEEQVVYPTARERLEDADDLVRDALREHQEVEKKLLELLDADAGDGDFMEKVTELRDLIDHHVEEEENELFPRLEEELGEDGLETLGDEVAQAKEEEQREFAAGTAGSRRRRGGSRSSREEKEPTKKELYEEARRKDIPGRSKMNKDELQKELGQA